MILEYCFIKGDNFKESKQISQYGKSLDVNFAVLDTIKLYKNNDSKSLTWLLTAVRNRFKTFSFENILKFLFRYRGEIAHGTKKAGKYITDESELLNVTNFIHQICLTICGNMQVYCEAFTKSKDSRLSERITELQEELKNIFDSTTIYQT